MDALDSFLAAYGLAAIFSVMFLKAVGVPIPIPSDVIMLAVAAGTANSKLVLWQAFLVLLLALVLGGFLQFLLARGPARSFLYRFGLYLGLNSARLDAAATLVKRRGALAIGLAIFTPGVRATAVAACGLAGTPLHTFVPGLLLGSTSFLSLHFLLGYAGAASLTQLARALPLPWALAALVVVLLVALAVWSLLRRRQLPKASRAQLAAEVLGAWQEAACPACLVLGASRRLLGSPIEQDTAKRPTP